LLLEEELGRVAKTRIEDVWDATDACRVVGGTVLDSTDAVEIEAEFLVWLVGSLDSKISLAQSSRVVVNRSICSSAGTLSAVFFLFWYT
jgi:hypothetical protein